MIQQQTILKVTDNSGAKTVKCIKVPGGFKKKIAKLGDIIVVSVQKLRNKSKRTSKVKKKRSVQSTDSTNKSNAHKKKWNRFKV